MNAYQGDKNENLVKWEKNKNLKKKSPKNSAKKGKVGVNHGGEKYAFQRG